VRVDAALSHEFDAALELVDRAVMLSFVSLANARSCAATSPGSARDGEKALDDAERVARHAAPLSVDCSRKRSAIRNLAPADIGGAGDRHQIGDQRERRFAIRAGKGREHAFVLGAAGDGRDRKPFEILLQADLAVEILD